MGVPKHFPYLVPPSGSGIPAPPASEGKEALRPHPTVGKPVSESDPQSKHQLEFLGSLKKKKSEILRKRMYFFDVRASILCWKWDWEWRRLTFLKLSSVLCTQEPVCIFCIFFCSEIYKRPVAGDINKEWSALVQQIVIGLLLMFQALGPKWRTQFRHCCQGCF